MKTHTILAGLLLTSTLPAQVGSPNEGFMQKMGQSMTSMNKGMTSAPMDGDVDHDFAAMMIPHHNGAVDMAKAELEFGKDPVMRRIAQEILVEQESEIDAMRLWMSKSH